MLTQTPTAYGEPDPDPTVASNGEVTTGEEPQERARKIKTAAARHHRLDQVAISSLVRISALMGASVFLVLLVGGLVAWWSVRAMGWVGDIEAFVAESLGVGSFTLPAASILMAWTALAAVVAVVVSLSVILMGLAYNRMARAVGGLELATTPLPQTSAEVSASAGDLDPEATGG